MLNSWTWSGVDITATVCDSSASHALQSGDKWHFGMRWCAYIHGFHILWGISYFNKVAFWFVSSSSFVPTCEKWVLQHSPNLHKAGFRALPLSPLAQIWPETLQLSDEGTAPFLVSIGYLDIWCQVCEILILSVLYNWSMKLLWLIITAPLFSKLC